MAAEPLPLPPATVVPVVAAGDKVAVFAKVAPLYHCIWLGVVELLSDRAAVPRQAVAPVLAMLTVGGALTVMVMAALVAVVEVAQAMSALGVITQVIASPVARAASV